MVICMLVQIKMVVELISYLVKQGIGFDEVYCFEVFASSFVHFRYPLLI